MKDFLEGCEECMWKLLPGVVLTLAVLWLYGCAERDAQRAVQASLTTLADGTVIADKAIADETPRLSKEAAVRAEAKCPAPCSDEAFGAVYDLEMTKREKAVQGVKLAQDSLLVAQGAVKIWIGTGVLPDTKLLCEGIADTVTPIPVLMQDAGVKNIPPEVEAFTGPVVKIGCDTISRWIKERRAR